MALRIEETEESRLLSAGAEPNQNSIDLEFFYWDTEHTDLDPVVVAAAVSAFVQASPYGDPLYGLRLQTINLRSLAKFAGTANVHYGVFEPAQITESPEYRVKVGFSTAGATEHITHSLATLSHPATGRVAAQHNNAIRVTKDGIQGTDRGVGQLAFRVTSFFDPSVWDATQWLNLNDLSYTWNLSDWKGWPAGYLLFEHAECADYEVQTTPPFSTGQMVPVTFHFKARRPEAVDKGNGIAFTKAPWSFIWDETITDVDHGATPVRKINRIICTHEEMINAGADFSLLGIGI